MASLQSSHNLSLPKPKVTIVLTVGFYSAIQSWLVKYSNAKSVSTTSAAAFIQTVQQDLINCANSTSVYTSYFASAPRWYVSLLQYYCGVAGSLVWDFNQSLLGYNDANYYVAQPDGSFDNFNAGITNVGWSGLTVPVPPIPISLNTPPWVDSINGLVYSTDTNPIVQVALFSTATNLYPSVNPRPVVPPTLAADVIAGSITVKTVVQAWIPVDYDLAEVNNITFYNTAGPALVYSGLRILSLLKVIGWQNRLLSTGYIQNVASLISRLQGYSIMEVNTAYPAVDNIGEFDLLYDTPPGILVVPMFLVSSGVNSISVAPGFSYNPNFWNGGSWSDAAGTIYSPTLSPYNIAYLSTLLDGYLQTLKYSCKPSYVEFGSPGTNVFFTVVPGPVYSIGSLSQLAHLGYPNNTILSAFPPPIYQLPDTLPSSKEAKSEEFIEV